MRRALLAALAAFLLGFAVGPGKADSTGSIAITDKVWGWYQEYLGLIGSTNRGAFAVSRNGHSAFAYYCADILCGGSPNYKETAVKRCESMSGSECTVFAYGRDIQLPYTVEAADPVEEVMAKASVAPEIDDPSFESPLADGTIVLSHKVAQELEEYLGYAEDRASAAYFYVSPDGRNAGAYGCVLNGAVTDDLPPCPHITGWNNDHLDRHRVQRKARDACVPSGAGDCVLLYADDTRKAPYKLLD